MAAGQGPGGLGAPKGPIERASVYVIDQDLFWPGAHSLGVTPLDKTRVFNILKKVLL